MWGIKATIVTVMIGTLGLVKKGMEKYTQKIPGNIKLHVLHVPADFSVIDKEREKIANSCHRNIPFAAVLVPVVFLNQLPTVA